MNMPAEFGEEISALLDREDTLKVLTTVDEQGVPHTVPKGSLRLGKDGDLILLELVESSRTNRNLIRSLWYDRTVSILLVGSNKDAYQIRGLPVKTYVSGPIYQKEYDAVRERLGDVDLAAVWIIRPHEVLNQSPSIRQKEERELHPLFAHLDRLVKAPELATDSIFPFAVPLAAE
jgi:predicted pyridoxine 5'-phosphate oxidase superfamily flavin-nucleotide-binding protein